MTATTHRSAAVGAVIFLLGGLLLVVAFTGGLPFLGGDGGRLLTARFAQADDVDPTTPVRVGGVDAGHVVALRPAANDTTSVVMRLDQAPVRIHSDASATIRWRTLLGGSMYIDLNPGSATAPPLEGEIPIARTSGQVDWDQFNNQLPTATRPQMQRQLRGLDMALRQPIIEGRTLAVIGPSLSTVGMSSSALRGEIPGDLTRMVQSTAATLRALSVSTTSLQTLVNDGDRTLAVTAGHRAALSSTIELSPAAESASITGNAILVRTLNALDPLVHRLRPGARLLGPATTALMPILSRTRQTLADARPVLSLLGPTVQRLGAAARQGTPLIGALTPTVLRLRTQLIPFLNTTDPDTRLKLYEALGPTASSLSSSQSGFDSNGFVYNFDVQVSTGSVELPCNTGLDGVAHASQCLTSVAPFAAAERKALAGAHR